LLHLHAILILPLFRWKQIISNVDLIINSTHQILLEKFNDSYVHCDIVDQFHKLLLSIFTFIAFDYDLEMSTANFFCRNLLEKFNSKYHRLISIIKKYFVRNNWNNNKRKRTSLIASLIHSLQINQSTKSGEDKKVYQKWNLTGNVLNKIERD
jgi:hypothetical protein